MQFYLYSYIELMGVLGCGTPDSPGTDFGMSVWIEATDEKQARAWGKRILQEFVRERFQYADSRVDPTLFEGEIETDPEMIEAWRKIPTIPKCKIGEIPNWVEPWKHDRASGPPRAGLA